MTVVVHLYTQSQPIIIREVLNTYQKGDMFCVQEQKAPRVFKFPLQHIFRITETEAPQA